MMAVLRANNVHDWAANFLLALAPDAEGGKFDRALHEDFFPGSAGLDQLRTIRAAPRPLGLDGVAALVP
jgi:hypothetical protein